ncbi:exo-alpha-sialidase [Salpingoeca rosetta]|uniref:Exo-alpha-sialidase n=1 Tax=Salpingoeca rosetta (strain ATCC 50818 / BSB-021) TaxID=946362 RepID=F2TXT0_SALR5|nr:exo-alpha-sialidase [Salpingoeca rosetta]EGD76189.1 exo-alpha-sialidase [Salpingoeca rosetta]|eukprot:XP_004998364.1 exo-alpha-sialidase [Salpingoeca rosetta]
MRGKCGGGGGGGGDTVPVLAHVVLLLSFFVTTTVTGLPSGQLVDVFKAGEEGYYCIKIPDLVVTGNGSLLAFGEARVSNCSDYAETHLVMKRSTDLGRTWSRLQVVHREAGAVIGNAAPVVLRTSGRILLPHCRNNLNIFLTYSDDDGLSWSAPVHVPNAVDPSWHWVGLGPPGGLHLQSGRVLIPAYYDNVGPHWDDGQFTHIHVMYSDDEGATWHIGAQVQQHEGDEFSNENQAAELLNGTLIFNARTMLTHRFLISSHDGGKTYAHDGALATTLVQPVDGCEGSTVRAPTNDTLYYSGPTATTLRYNMTLHHSTDYGATWAPLRVVDKGPSGYSALAFLPTGQLGMLYERSPDLRVVFVPTAISFLVVM